jgi:uncharacterized protein
MASPLTPDESRVLGVLIEKAQTTPAQYPLSLNAVVVGVNQKNNRFPVVTIDEDRAMTALDGLRAKSLAREVNLSGSRVQKFRHVAREVLNVSTSELVVLAELLLRGPQTVGEIRGNASRMHPLESLESTRAVLESLMGRGEPTGPLAREVSPAPGSRAPRFAQLLCENLHPIDFGSAPAAAQAPATAADSGLSGRVEALEEEVAKLRESLATLAAALGQPL